MHVGSHVSETFAFTFLSYRVVSTAKSTTSALRSRAPISPRLSTTLAQCEMGLVIHLLDVFGSGAAYKLDPPSSCVTGPDHFGVDCCCTYNQYSTTSISDALFGSAFLPKRA